MKKVLIALVMSFNICLNLNGQSDFRPGFIMPKANDSIGGLIDYRNDRKNSEHCVYRDNSKSSVTYNPFEIYGYRFTEGKFYISKYIRKNGRIIPSFVEYLVKGKKNLYYKRDEAGSHFLIDYSNDTVIEIVYKVDHIYRDGVEFIGDTKTHQAYLKAYFQDCPALSKEIETIKVPNISNLVSLTKEYHHLTYGDTGCVVFYKKPYKFRVDLEFRLGMIMYPEYSETLNLQYAGLVHFWLPRSNERMYVITGLIYSPLKVYDLTYSIYKIPLKFEYLFPFRVLIPRFEGGVNFMVLTENKKQAGIGIDFPISVGVLICPVRFIGLDLSVEGEFFPFVDIQNFKFNQIFTAYSFNAGICLRF